MSLPPAGEIREAARQLEGPVPYVERELASVLAVWLKSVHRRMLGGSPVPDQPYATEIAQLVLRRGLARKV